MFTVSYSIYVYNFLFQGAVFDGTSDVLRVSKTVGFVDKTPLVKSVFKTGQRMSITAPRKFGKSTNLERIRVSL